MKIFRNMFLVLKRLSIGLLSLGATALMLAGCQTTQVPAQSDVQSAENVSIERVRISALTEFVAEPADPDKVRLKVLLECLDALGAPVPAPGVIRFELYEFHPLSSDPRGRRLWIWPEKDLTEADNADQYWKALLRGHEFYLPLDPVPRLEEKYVLEATCIDGQRRRSDLFKLQFLPSK